MKLALRILVTALLAALLAVPAASAKQGGGHGKGAEKAKAAHALKADKADKAAKKAAKKAEKEAKKAEKAAKTAAKQAEQAEKEEQCEAAPSATEVLGGLFGSDESACEAEEEEEQAEQALEPPNLESLGPGQYCHQLEAWMVASGGDFSQTFGTEGSGFSNDHGKCASRRAHGEDLLAAATDALPEQEQPAGAAEELELEPPNLEGLGPGQYCHALEAWMAANGGDFSQTFGTEGSGFANDHGKCASRRAHGEDLLAVATAALPKEEEQAQTEPAAPAAAELTDVLRLVSF